MGVIGCPRGRWLAFVEVVEAADLQPAEETVQVRRAFAVAPDAIDLLDLPKPAEEEEEVTFTDAPVA
jgi:hypothetical protein